MQTSDSQCRLDIDFVMKEAEKSYPAIKNPETPINKPANLASILS